MQVRWGHVYRSGHFGDLSSEGQRALAELGIATAIDLRNTHERETRPNRFHRDHELRVLEIPIDPGSLGALRAPSEGEGSRDGWSVVMEELNRCLVRDHAGSFRRVFEVLCSDSGGAQVIHCASGKDRTGIASALLLAALGVERATIVEDYLLTNTALDLEREVGSALKDFGGPAHLGRWPAQQLRPLVEARDSYLLAALDEIDRELGGMEVYLREQLGLDDRALGRLREHYLCSETAR
jgi:protein-tyrosine phosphatase